MGVHAEGQRVMWVSREVSGGQSVGPLPTLRVGVGWGEPRRMSVITHCGSGGEGHMGWPAEAVRPPCRSLPGPASVSHVPERRAEAERRKEGEAGQREGFQEARRARLPSGI